MALKTDFKDEILPSGQRYRTYNIVDQYGSPIYRNVHLERAYVPTQEGDEYGAKEVNEQNLAINNVDQVVGQAVKEVQDTLGVQNFLINGGLKVWLRGDSIQLSNSKWTFAAEMFRCKGTGTATKVNNGMKFSSAAQVQYKLDISDYNKLKGKTISTCVCINGVPKTKTFVVNKQVIIDFTAQGGDTMNWATACIGNTALTIEPVEPYAKTLHDCSRYCVVLMNHWAKRLSIRSKWAKIYFPCGEMVREPTVIGGFDFYSSNTGLVAKSDLPLAPQKTQIAIMIDNNPDDGWVQPNPDKTICDAQDYSD